MQFEGNVRTYNTLKGSKLAYMCKISYEDNIQHIITSKGSKECEKYPLIDVEVIEDQTKMLRFFVGRFKQNGQIVVCFRGVNHPISWWNQIKEYYVEYPTLPNAKVHHVFFHCYEKLRKKFIQQYHRIVQKGDSKLPILVTGHNIGAAMASLCAIDIKHAFIDRQVELYTFGQPKIGNKIFCFYAHALIGTVYFVVHDKDRILHEPNTAGYKHLGTQIHYNEEMDQYQIHQSQSESSGVFGMFNTILSNFSLSDHFCEKYLPLKVLNEEEYSIIKKKITEKVAQIIKKENQKDDISKELLFVGDINTAKILPISNLAVPYNTHTASRLIHLSKIIYHKNLDNIKNWKVRDCQKYKVTDIMLHDDPDQNYRFMAGFFQETKDIVICFRGSVFLQNNPLDNLFTDLSMSFIDYQQNTDLQVHSGFFKAYQYLKKTVHQFYNSLHLKYPSATLLVTGHSLGGAIASFCALDLKLTYQHQHIQLYTFGQPRIGNKKFCDYGEKILQTIYLIIHDKDPVPHYPGIKGYTHMGKQVHYNEQMSQYNIEQAEDNLGAFTWSNGLASIQFWDHLPTTYIKLFIEHQPKKHIKK